MRRTGPVAVARVGAPAVTDAELVCLAVAPALLRYDDQRRWLRAVPLRVGHLFARLLTQSGYNDRLKKLAPLMEATLRWLADGTPIPCGACRVTTLRSDLFGYAGYGYEASHSRWYWGMKLMLICTVDGHRVRVGQPQAARRAGADPLCWPPSPANRPEPGSVIVADKGFAGDDFEQFLESDDLHLLLVEPARRDQKRPRPLPNWLREPVEAIISTLNNQLGLERHGARVGAGLWARIVPRLLP